MFDEALLDAPDQLLRADPRGLLRAAASAGAQVRSAARGAAESPLVRLTPEGRPGTVLHAGLGPQVPLLADLFEALAGDALRVETLRPGGPAPDPGALTWPLPRWVGPLDLLLITSHEGAEPGLALLVEAAARRGCSVVAVTPERSPLAEAVTHRRGLLLPLTGAPFQEPTGTRAAPGPAWALLTPLLLLGDRLGLFEAPDATLQRVADQLDRVAERCGPATRTQDNPAKELAAHLGAALPLLWSEGPLAGVVARHARRTLTGLAGRPALDAALPEALEAHAPLLSGDLAGATDPDDFFRDRVEEPEPLRPYLLLFRDPPPHGAPGGLPSAADAARDLAFDRGVGVAELAPEADEPLVALARSLAETDFAAVYLTLAAGHRG
ncbi:phospho-glucose isomerase C-terminal SIS domain-containing protein [Streptomyces zhaozhouensis]|uniref:Phospho-glucose isomerase C-terminal SIS domain-containing protein n=1 Tax=Streptomyces zhaozhouensis TaxID=1300267 RepID=A0A286E2I4_9ACTN|nr:SIS domain-containing protein [Streptomyces zhaozhouensis]SOD65128.1 phospho-glucose isomerase C-terminal SIS domain-containing protein [Streptomyces zhaozhouensis]